jgi:glutamate synthase (NADPH/NADH)
LKATRTITSAKDWRQDYRLSAEGFHVVPEENMIVGNVGLYGATSGEIYIRGMAGERFGVRNSGVYAVVEAVGDHGCEYMTGGRVVVLGATGRNFAAGMSGGVAYVLDVTGDFPTRCNKEMVELSKLTEALEIAEVRGMIDRHARYTNSTRAQHILKLWDDMVPKFVKVMPKDYKNMLESIDRARNRVTRRGRIVESISGKHASVGEIIRREFETQKSMGKPTGFMEFKRELPDHRAACDWNEFHEHMPELKLKQQGARCMDCGVPFCHTGKLVAGMASGCPINNLIPEWNDLVYRGLWQEALDRLFKTNNFPEFTGRVCPAPCEGSCVLGINEPPVTIKNIECAIIDRGWDEGWVKPFTPSARTGKRVASSAQVLRAPAPPNNSIAPGTT